MLVGWIPTGRCTSTKAPAVTGPAPDRGPATSLLHLGTPRHQGTGWTTRPVDLRGCRQRCKQAHQLGRVHRLD
jgi:hypothetical protein